MQPANFKERLFDPLVYGLVGTWRSGLVLRLPAHVFPLVPHFPSYLAGSISLTSGPSDPDTITNTTFEAIAVVEWQ